MAQIISVSYDETLLRTRQLMLQSSGHQVTSALGFNEAKEQCSRTADLVIIGHSIPKKDKLDLIAAFRASNPKGVFIALTRVGEDRLKEVDHYINPGEPEDLLRAVDRIVNKRAPRDNVRYIR